MSGETKKSEREKRSPKKCVTCGKSFALVRQSTRDERLCSKCWSHAVDVWQGLPPAIEGDR